MSAKDDILNGGKRKKKKDNAAAPSQSNETVGGSGASVETREVHLPNLNVRGKNQRKPLKLGIEPTPAEVETGKIDESKMPAMDIDVNLDNIDVVAKNKRKPLDLGIKPVKAEIDTRKAKEVPIHVSTPTRNGGELPEVVVEGNRKTSSANDSGRQTDMELPELVVEGKRKSLGLGIKPVKAEVDTRKAKEIPLYVQTPTKNGGELPEVVVEGERKHSNEQDGADVQLPELVVNGKRKPLKLDMPATKQPEVDKRKIEKEVPLYVPTPERAKKAQEYAKNIKMAGIDIDEGAKKAPSLADKIEGGVPSSLSKWDSVLPEVVVEGKRPTVAQPTQAESDAKRKKFADDIYSKFAPYVMGPQATEETIKKGHSVYDIEKEKQAKRDQEKIDDYTSSQAQRIMKEAFKDGGTKPAAPVVDENVPIIDSTLEKEEALPVPEKKVTSEKKEEPTIPKANSVGSMMDIVDEYAKKMQPSKEQLEKERRRRKAAAIFAAIGDGVSAWANLQATVGGAPSVKQSTNLSSMMQERYDKLRKEREEKAKEIMAYRMRAHESDRQQANADRNYAEGVRRYDTSLENTKKQQAQQQKNWETTRQDGIDQRNQAQENWQKTFDANEAHRKSQTAIQQANAETAKKRAEAYAQRQAANQAGTLRGKKIGFSDGDKNEVAIYENVWKGSKQNVYNAILEDGIKPTSIEQFDMNTPAKVDEWIKKNWTKSPKARAIMLALSGVDPAAVLSQVEGSEDESFEEYAETEDDFEQYAE